MRSKLVRDLAEVTEFRLTLQAGPPVLVHGTVFLLALLMGAALTWLAVTPVDLVVRATGRVRPVMSPMRVVSGSSGEVLSTSRSGRVIAVYGREGEAVRQGDVLMQLDTERLDNDIAKQRRLLQASADELATLQVLETLAEDQFASLKAKGEAELAQAQDEVAQAQARWQADLRAAELALQHAAHEEVQSRQLAARGLVAQDMLRKASARLQESQEKVRKFRVPLETGKVEVLRRALILAQREYAMRCQELHAKQQAKRSEAEAMRLELANLELERAHASLRAPIDGVIIAGDVKVGDVLERGKPAMVIAAQQGFQFEVAVPSEEVAHLQPGMPARLKLDAYDYQRYGTVAGTVVFIAPDSEVLGGPHITTYVVKVALATDIFGPAQQPARVKLGMAGQAEIITGQERLLTLLVKKMRQTISLG